MGELQGARAGTFNRRKLPPSVESDAALVLFRLALLFWMFVMTNDLLIDLRSA